MGVVPSSIMHLHVWRMHVQTFYITNLINKRRNEMTIIEVGCSGITATLINPRNLPFLSSQLVIFAKTHHKSYICGTTCILHSYDGNNIFCLSHENKLSLVVIRWYFFDKSRYNLTSLPWSQFGKEFIYHSSLPIWRQIDHTSYFSLIWKLLQPS